MDKAKQTYTIDQQDSNFGFIYRDENGCMILDLSKWNIVEDISRDGRGKGKIWEEGERNGAEEKSWQVINDCVNRGRLLLGAAHPVQSQWPPCWGSEREAREDSFQLSVGPHRSSRKRENGPDIVEEVGPACLDNLEVHVFKENMEAQLISDPPCSKPVNRGEGCSSYHATQTDYMDLFTTLKILTRISLEIL